MMITEPVIAEIRVFKLILYRIQANITTMWLMLAELVVFKLIAKRILANLCKEGVRVRG